MLRRLILFLVVPLAAATAQIWPEAWYGSTREKADPIAVQDQAIWTEYGGEAAERAVYNGRAGKFAASAWRLQDSTAALAFYQASRPEKCIPVRGSVTLCTVPSGIFLAHQNYVLLFDGWRPLEKEMTELYGKLPGLRSGGGLPFLPGYLPERNRVRNSERYILGADSLRKFVPAIPAALAGFEDSAEAQFGKFHDGQGGEIPLAIFYYHTPQLAQVKVAQFEKQADWTVRRSGPLVAIIPQKTDPKAARALLGGLTWKADFIWNEATAPPPMPNVGGMLLAIFELTGLLLVLCIGGGICFAGARYALRQRRVRLHGSDEEITFLNLG